MRLFRFLLKIPVCPIVLCGKVLQWFGIFIAAMSAWIFYVAAFLLFMLALVCVIFQKAELSQTRQALGFSFVIFILPHIWDWFIARVTDMNDALLRFLRS